MRLRSFVKEEFVDHKVGDVDCRFHPVSPKVLVENLVVFKGVMAVCSRLLQGPAGTQAEQHEANGQVVSTVIAAPDPKLVQAGKDMRAREIELLAEAVKDSKIRIALARIIIDSVRDNELDGAEDAVVATWIDNRDMNLRVLLDLLMGVWRANHETFRPFVEKVRTMLAPHLEKVRARMLQQMIAGPSDGPTTT